MNVVNRNTPENEDGVHVAVKNDAIDGDGTGHIEIRARDSRCNYTS